MTKSIKAKSKTERKSLTQAGLWELLYYDSDTGRFTWLVKRKGTRLDKQAGWMNPRKYRHIIIDQRMYFEHRLAWLYTYGCWPANQIDHINRDPSDNRICNLREATCSENRINAKRQVNNTSGYKGVVFDNQCCRWRAQIKINGSTKHLGHFDNPKDAYKIYCHAAKTHFGKFANAV